ncbi:TRAP-type C4-dicarboxylate transport system, small permease component [Amycolatopsis marina]|uniref:TRAP-type C4-dicarboxylate transport system, small permease component n=1 Tax=Amycolatopsis marina TaxID=490629 RepID=A0A1I0YLN1_9PSEU|nr:TRAP transporter small permease [Amycolatopsis marina]SFB13053.1 TRAP-type C4-dicarboxylate transport system, small permease component [Amycolatopsis marina]
MDRIDAVAARVAKALALVAALLVGMVMVVVAVDVVGRNVTGSSVPGAFEITTVLLVVIVFLGLAHAERTGATIKLTLLTDRLPRRAALGTRVASAVITLAVALWFTYATLVAAGRSIDRGEAQVGLLNIPLWPARVAIVVGFAALSIEVLLGLRRGLSGSRRQASAAGQQPGSSSAPDGRPH